jgi:DNA-binding transcriptional LysR family regulator
LPIVELRHLRCFAGVVQHGGFRRAARSMGMTQPNLSEHIQQLEADLGFKLFNRLHRPVQLTTAGHRVLVHAQELLAVADRLEADAARIRTRHPGGRVTLGSVYLHAPVLTPVLADFAEQHPHIDVLLREERSEDLLRLVGQGELDACILVIRPSDETLGDALDKVHLHSYASTFVVPPTHRLAGRSDVSFAECAGERFILSVGHVSRMLKKALASAAVSDYTVFETNGSDMILSLVAQGIGIGFAPDFRIAQSETELATFDVIGFEVRNELVLAWPPASDDNPILRALIDFVGSLDWGKALHH